MIILADLNKKDTSFVESIVNDDERLLYKSFNDILLSVKSNINKYITNIDLNKINLTLNYKFAKDKTLDKNFNGKKIVVNPIKIEFNEINSSHFSKETHELIDEVTRNKMDYGTYMHELLESIDFKNINIDDIDDTYKNNILSLLNHDVFKDLNDAKIFKEYEFIYEEDNYQILFPQNVDEAIFYMYDELDYKTTNKSWTINYYCELIYYTDFDDSLLVNELYSNLVHLIDEIEVLIDDQIELSKPYEMIEKEVTIDNIFNDEISCVFFDEYLPLRLRNTDKNISCSISVPIKRSYLVKSKDKIQNPFNTEIMNWDDFLAIPNIKNNL